MRHGILFHIAEKIFNNSPQPPAVCVYILGILWKIFYQLKPSRLKSLHEFTAGLHEQLLYINSSNVQHHIAGAGS